MNESLRGRWSERVDPRRGLIVRLERPRGHMRLMRPVGLKMAVALLLVSGIVFTQNPVRSFIGDSFKSFANSRVTADNAVFGHENRSLYPQNVAARSK